MKAYGGTCPMCCGDLDDVAYRETGAVVCVFCGHGHDTYSHVLPDLQRDAAEVMDGVLRSGIRRSATGAT